MVRLSPDVGYRQPTNGYRTGSPVVAFSHTHVSGTGGSGRYGNIGVFPFEGEPRRNPVPPFLQPPIVNRTETIPRDEAGSVGYYAARIFDRRILVELACSEHVGVHRYTFPTGSSPSILIDAGAVIQSGMSAPGHTKPAEIWDSSGASIGGFIDVVSPTEIIGRGDFLGGWGHHKTYSVYFAATWDNPAQDILLSHGSGVVPGGVGRQVHGAESRAVLRFPDAGDKAGAAVNMRVGISFVSIAAARASIQHEVGSKNLEEVVTESRTVWENHLSRVETEGDEKVRRIFASCHYRLLCMPTDLGVDRENPFWESGVRQFTDFYALWDSVRNTNSLLMWIEEGLARDILRALLDIGEHVGYIPDAHIALQSAFMQSGGSAPILFREAACKGLTGVDFEKALELVRRDSETESPDPLIVGRYNSGYNNLGYVSSEVDRSAVSRHIEYAYYDWCIGKLAEQLGRRQVAHTYLEQSERLWNLWNDDLSAFAPKDPNGEWVTTYDPSESRPDHYNDPYFYEAPGESWKYNTFGDFHELIRRSGGERAFVEQLDRYFSTYDRALRPKETRMHIPFLYTYAGRPDRTAEIIHHMLRESYSLGPRGLSDNEDMGCQSAFYMFCAAGIYPIVGQDLYILVPPLLEETVLPISDSGATVRIEAGGAGPQTYIQSATLNGKPLDRAWVRHGELAKGAHVRLTLSKTPGTWGTENRPPSA
jgi:predicted alpha-1,2-mannosidase